MSDNLNQLVQSGSTVLILLVVAIAVSVILTLLRKYDITLKKIFGNTPLMNKIIDDVIKIIHETVLEISEEVSKRYKDDGVITKDELEQIKIKAIEIIVEKLNESQSSIIESVYGDIMDWVTEQVQQELDKLVE